MSTHGVVFLMYHAIAEDIQPLEAEYSSRPADFDHQMRSLADAGYESRTVAEVVSAWDRGDRLPEKTVVITFDDGFSCLHDTALPIMRRHGIRATAYVISGYLDRMARYDAALGVRARPMLSRSQVLELAAEGMEIGSHSVNHFDLPTLTPRGLQYEVTRSKCELEDLTSRPVESFAFPRGRFDSAVYAAVKQAGYTSACATIPGKNDASSDRFLLRRAQIGMQTDAPLFRKLLRHGAAPLRLFRANSKRRLIDCVAAMRGIDPLDLYNRSMGQAFRSTVAALRIRPADNELR
jgi:peptidoglycan/xylan/chitin deacetylase (PgdA/CDA1 family)